MVPVPSTAASRPAGNARRLRGTRKDIPDQPVPANGTVLLSRGSGTVAWTGGEILLYDGDVSAYRTVRIAASAYTECGGVEFRVVEIADPTAPIVFESSRSERNFHDMKTVLDAPGQRIAVRVWIDDCPIGKVELTWGVWGRPG
jgi:hypothetical protein